MWIENNMVQIHNKSVTKLPMMLRGSHTNVKWACHTILSQTESKLIFLNWTAFTDDSEVATVVLCSLFRQLITHLRSEHRSPDGTKPCPSCSESFSEISELARHLESNHSYKADNDFGLSLARLNGNACYFEGCVYKNPHADALLRHLHQKHGVGQPSLPCPSCSRKYFSIG